MSIERCCSLPSACTQTKADCLIWKCTPRAVCTTDGRVLTSDLEVSCTIRWTQTCTDERRYNCKQLIAPSKRIAEGRSENGNSALIELNLNTLEDALVSELSPRAYLPNACRTQGRTAIPPGNTPLPGRPWCEKHDGHIGNIGPFLSQSRRLFRLA